MSNRFIKFIPSEKANWLLEKHPWAFLLLCQIAQRARRAENKLEGLGVGECYIGDHKSFGATRGQYRHALKILQQIATIEISETCRNRKKTTTGATTVGTKVKLLGSDIWDININESNQRNDHPTTTEQPPNNHEQECNKKEKNVKEEDLSSDSDEYGLAVYHFDLLKKINPKQKKPNFQKWAKTISYLITQDSRPKDEIREMLTWIFSSTNKQAFFWRTVIKSPSSLRENWDQMILQRKVVPLNAAPQTNREYVLSMFKHGQFYHGAECFIDENGIAFHRGQNHQSLKFSEKGFKEQFNNLLRKFGIQKQPEAI